MSFRSPASNGHLCGPAVTAHGLLDLNELHLKELTLTYDKNLSKFQKMQKTNLTPNQRSVIKTEWNIALNKKFKFKFKRPSICGQSVSDPLQHIPYKNNLSWTANCLKRPFIFGPQGDRLKEIWLYKLSSVRKKEQTATDTFESSIGRLQYMYCLNLSRGLRHFLQRPNFQLQLQQQQQHLSQTAWPTCMTAASFIFLLSRHLWAALLFCSLLRSCRLLPSWRDWQAHKQQKNWKHECFILFVWVFL
jgi:hypothetical protein